MQQTENTQKGFKTQSSFLKSKKRIQILTILLSGGFFYFSSVKAETIGQMPTLKPNACPYSVIVPENLTNRTYFSRDCKTVYITPREIGSLRFSKPLKVGSASPEICQAVQKRKERLSHLSDALDITDKKIEDLRGKLENATADTSLRYKELIAMYQNDKVNFKTELENGWAPFDTWPAARVQAFFETGLMQDVDLFRKSNSNLTAVSFQPLPIQTGTLYFTPANSHTISYKGVLSIQVPGKTIQNVGGQLPLNSVEMNGGLSGLIELSVPMVCDLVANPSEITNTNLSGLIVGNYYYTFNAEAGVRVQASANISAIDLGKVVNQEITKTQFTRSDLLNTVYSGTLASHLQISIDDGGNSVPMDASVLFKENEEGKSTVSLLLGKVFSFYFEQIENKLIHNENIIKIETPTLKDMEPGEVTVPNGVINVCNNSSSFFGLIQSRHCHQQVIYKKVNIAGRSVGNRTTVDEQNLVFSLDIHEQQSIPVVHSMTFGNQN